MKLLKIEEAKFAESVWCGPGECHERIGRDQTHLKMFLTPTLLYIYNEKLKRLFGTSTANLRQIIPMEIPSELIDEIMCKEVCGRNDKESEPKTTAQINQKSRIRSTK